MKAYLDFMVIRLISGIGGETMYYCVCEAIPIFFVFLCDKRILP